MPHETPLIATIVAGIVLAFIFGGLAFRLRLSPLIGYLLAGVLVGPFTPGYVADQGLANELAELGIILLMFGVGLHFSLRDLMAVRTIAIPGAIVQILVAIAMGFGLSAMLGWPYLGGLVFGLALSVASTVVLLRALQERRIVDTERGRIAVGWLIVEDLVMVLALVMLPALAGADGGAALGLTLLATMVKVAVFIILMLVVGRRAIPWLLHGVAHTGSRELFRLAVLAIALGIAFGAAKLFGVSFALGAFFAGMILAESPLSQRATEETLPLRDAFAVLFFVSVGMLFNPAVLIEEPLPLLATVAIIIVGKSVAAFAIVRLFGRSNMVALTIAASLAQIGEFSFILASLGTSLQLFPADARDLILAGAIISIMVNPLLFIVIDKLTARAARAEKEAEEAAAGPVVRGHVVLVGHGRVGRIVRERLATSGELVVIDTEPDVVDLKPAAGLTIVTGNAARPEVLAKARLGEARLLLVAIPNVFEAGQVVDQARRRNPDLRIVARAHSEGDAAHLEGLGANLAIMAEREIATRMAELALRRG
ncbi:Kef family K(+) transporter [Sphingobium sufflavum]|uniref:YbaL family putative K(+) efflux transporter n=1 Tax=Sphingobium sufflavum TaxID=1129547 RepID=UPI001F1C983D|nr:YbaL family putative K(+) efflux transporter [Sphingobium sufflavum]MCE7798345.1 Kef family K(+) transporter [Sphingobium sufflavum]